MAMMNIFLASTHDSATHRARCGYVVTAGDVIIEKATWAAAGCAYPVEGDYAALKRALETIKKIGFRHGRILTDSKILFMQLHNNWLEGPPECSSSSILWQHKQVSPEVERLWPGWQIAQVAAAKNPARRMLEEEGGK